METERTREPEKKTRNRNDRWRQKNQRPEKKRDIKKANGDIRTKEPERTKMRNKNAGGDRKDIK